MSDGLPELFNQSGEMLGYDEPQKMLARYASLEPTEFIACVEAEIQKFNQGEPLHDDVSIIFIRKERF